jgi:hypothetical protein
MQLAASVQLTAQQIGLCADINKTVIVKISLPDAAQLRRLYSIWVAGKSSATIAAPVMQSRRRTIIRHRLLVSDIRYAAFKSVDQCVSAQARRSRIADCLVDGRREIFDGREVRFGRF